MGFMQRLGAFTARQTTVKPACLRFARPVASFTFDDFPRSAWDAGAPVLERFGARGTFYAAGRYCGAREDGLDYYDAAMLRVVVAGGHEVGCHSFGHQPGPAMAPEALEADLARNAAFLGEAAGLTGPFSFAYPFGLVSTRTKRLAGARYPSARGIHPGVNGRDSDLSQLKAIALERRSWRPDVVERWVETARAEQAWLVFFTHDVGEDPSPYGCTQAMLEHALAAVTAGGFDLAPVKQALALAIS